MIHALKPEKKKMYGTVYRNTQFLHASKEIIMTIEVYKPYRKNFLRGVVELNLKVEEVESSRMKTVYKVVADRETQQMVLWDFSTRLTHAFF